MSDAPEYVSRAGEKLHAALERWPDLLQTIEGGLAADLGANVGGFTDCLLRRGAAKVYSVDTGYGVLAWKLRQDERVVVLERTNALYVELPEQVDIVVCDVAWTRQQRILPAAWRLVQPGGPVVTLVKPQYESEPRERKKGVVAADALPAILDRVRASVAEAGGQIVDEMESPLRGGRGNVEYLWLVHQSLSGA